MDISLEERAKIKTIFTHLDFDGSGYLDRDEIVHSLQELGMDASSSIVDKIFKDFGFNGRDEIPYTTFERFFFFFSIIYRCPWIFVSI